MPNSYTRSAEPTPASSRPLNAHTAPGHPSTGVLCFKAIRPSGSYVYSERNPPAQSRGAKVSPTTDPTTRNSSSAAGKYA